MPIPFDGIPFTIQPISESSRKMQTTNDFNCMCDDDDSEIKKKTIQTVQMRILSNLFHS